MMESRICSWVQKMVNADFPGCARHLTGYVAIIAGALMTIVVQSSSVFTSTLTPLVGIGLIKVERMYPLTLGSNIGTTMTSILAALAAPGSKIQVALQIAFCHLFFNITGILIFYPIPAMRNLPIRAAKFLGRVTARYRWFCVFYLILMFLLLPLVVFVLSLAGRVVIISVLSVVAALVFIVILLNIMQKKCQNKLPESLRTWEFLPKPLRSLEPYDSVISSILTFFKNRCPCKCNKEQSEQTEDQKSLKPLISGKRLQQNITLTIKSPKKDSSKTSLQFCSENSPPNSNLSSVASSTSSFSSFRSTTPIVKNLKFNKVWRNFDILNF